MNTHIYYANKNFYFGCSLAHRHGKDQDCGISKAVKDTSMLPSKNRSDEGLS